MELDNMNLFGLDALLYPNKPHHARLFNFT